MGNLYGKPKTAQTHTAAPAPSAEEQIKVLEKRKAYTETRMNHATEQAKQCLQTNDKGGAERWLRQMTMFRKEQTQICAMLEKLEALQGAYQQARITRDVLLATDGAAQRIQALGITADKADDVMDRARDAIADVEDVNRAIMAPLSRTNDSEIEEELAKLEAEPVKVHDMPEPPVSVRPPTPPMVREMRELIPA